MTHADGEYQERHQQADRVDAVVQQHQCAELPDHRDHRAQHRYERDAPRLAVDAHRQQCQDQRNGREQNHRARTVGDVAHHLGEADDAHVDPVSLERLAHPPLELVGDLDGIHPPALCVLIEDDGAHQRAGEIVRHQPSNDAGLSDVVAHQRQVLRAGCEVCRHYVARLDAVFNDLEIAHVGGIDRLHARAVDAVHDDDFVGGLAQRGKELRREHVAVARDQRDQHAVRALEFRELRIEVGPHVLVPHRQRLDEGRVDTQPVHRDRAEESRAECEQRENERPMPEDELLEPADHDRREVWGISARVRHQRALLATTAAPVRRMSFAPSSPTTVSVSSPTVTAAESPA